MNKMRNSTTRNRDNHLTFEKHNNYTKKIQDRASNANSAMQKNQ